MVYGPKGLHNEVFGFRTARHLDPWGTSSIPTRLKAKLLDHHRKSPRPKVFETLGFGPKRYKQALKRKPPHDSKHHIP